MKILKVIFLLLVIINLTYSQSLDGVKVCIDPGHGGHDPANDRYIPGPEYWESEGNYAKALHVEDILTSLGATVIVTRKGNSDSDDLALSVRAGIANSNNVDLFQSIHSNATGTSTRRNTTLILFRGYDNSPVYPEAKTYAIKVYRNIEKVDHVTDLSWDNVRGDWSFYSWGTSGLGVLRPLTMPGVLSEGSFHDYIPEARRLKNDGYLRHEAWAITRAMLEYFNGGTLKNGNVAGIARDPLISVPASYQPISGLNDSKQPLNGVTATLQPGNHVYHGDDQNNGYYFFENITPGNYKLYVTAEDYTIDSASITVTANKSLFIDKNLSLVPNENSPNVVTSVPENHFSGFSNAASIEILFDIRMDKSSTEAAFSITPNVSGKFSWEDNQKRLIFNPDANLTPGEKYTVKIANTAKTIFDKNLLFGYNFDFTTRSKLNMLLSYPQNGEKEVSKTVQIYLKFDNAINSSTLPGNVSFVDADGESVSLAVDYTLYSQGIIAFEPTKPLNNGALYKVAVGENIGDIEGVSFQENREIVFTVETKDIIEGNLIDDFETAGNWGDPNTNENSAGISPDSKFEISSSEKYAGTFAGKITYQFSQDDAYYKISRLNLADIGNDVNSDFGIWVKGDLSQNILEYWFSDSGANLHSVVVDTLNYTGWKMKSVKLSDISATGLKFEGIGIKRASEVDSIGIVFIDNAQYDFTTPVNSEEEISINSYVLEQNYPNPFNPSTVIKYSIPLNVKGETTNVKLVVYDILGREVSTLVNKQQKAGNYEVKFDAGNFTSGVYLYKLQAGSFVSTKKMILVK